MPPIHSLANELRALPRAFWVLFTGTFINRFGSFVYPFLTILLHGRGFDYGDIGMAVGSFGFGGLLSSLAGGWFADRFGRRNSIVLGTFANALFVFSIYWVHALPAIIVLTVMAGFTGGFFHPASSALIADIVPAHLQLRAYAAQRVAANAGFAFGTAAGGFLVTHSTFWLFAGDALTTASYGVLALLMLPHGLRHTSAQARWGEALRRLRHDGKFWALAAAQFCCALVFTQFASSYSLEVIGRGLVLDLFGVRIAAEQIFGLLIGWNGVLIVLCELPLTRTTQRFEPRRVMCLGYILLGGGFALNAAPGGFATLFAAMTLFTLGEMVAIPMSSTWIARIAPETMRGRYIGALQMAWAAANVVGPQIGLRLYGVQPLAVWLGCGMLGLVAAATLWRFGDREHEPAAVQVEPAA
jgi:MFS family permease